MQLGYHTNGFSNHSLAETIEILSRIGYQSVAVTLERTHLDPPDHRGVQHCVDLLKPSIQTANLNVTIETGSRYILDPHHKHRPTLLSRDVEKRKLRIDFLKAAIETAAALQAQSVSLWSGTADDGANEHELHERLAESLGEILCHAQSFGIRLAFEPEPGMFIDTMARFETMYNTLDHPLLGLTLDVGHVHCLDDGVVWDHVHRWRDILWNVHIEDMIKGKHEHLMFGDGEMDFKNIFSGFKEIQYTGPIHVELSRHSHRAEEAARKSYRFLNRYV